MQRHLLSALLILSVSTFAAAQTGTFTKFGKGCAGTDGTPSIWSSGAPTIGKPYALRCAGGKKSGAALLIFGATKTNYKGLTLPFDMSKLGAKGCTLYVGHSVFVATKLDANGTGINTFTIPNLTSLVGVEFHNQYYVVDAKANAMGGITSDAGTSKVGK